MSSSSTGSPAGPFAARSARTGPVYDPARGVVQREVRPRERATRCRRGRRRREGRLPRLARRVAGQAPAGDVRVPRAAERAEGRARRDPHLASTARSLSRRRSARSPAASRSSSSRPAFPHLLKGEFTENVSTGVDVYSTPAAARRRRHHLPVQLPGDGADVVLPDRDRGGQHRRPEAEREGPVRRDLDGRAVQGGRPARRRLQRRCTATRTPVDALLDAPRRRSRSRSSARPRSRSTSTRPAAKHGKRVQALGGAKNHMLVLPDADLDLVADSAVNAGFGSAGERCMAISRRRRGRAGRRRADREDHRADGGPQGRRRHAAAATWARSSPRSTATRSPATSTSRSTDGADVVVDGRGIEVDGDADGFWLGPTLIDKVPTTSDVYTEEIFGPVLSIVRVADLRGGSRADQLGAVRQRHRDLHERRRGRAPLPARGRGRHDRHQRADPGAGRLLLVRRLEGLAVRRHEGVRPRGRPLLHARRRRSPPAGSTRRHGGINLGLPAERLTPLARSAASGPRTMTPDRARRRGKQIRRIGGADQARRTVSGHGGATPMRPTRTPAWRRARAGRRPRGAWPRGS